MTGTVVSYHWPLLHRTHLILLLQFLVLQVVSSCSCAQPSLAGHHAEDVISCNVTCNLMNFTKKYRCLINCFVTNVCFSYVEAVTFLIQVSLSHTHTHTARFSCCLWSNLPSWCYYLLTQRRNHNKLSVNELLFCWPSTMTEFYSEFWHQELDLSALPQNKGWGQHPNQRELSPKISPFPGNDIRLWLGCTKSERDEQKKPL